MESKEKQEERSPQIDGRIDDHTPLSRNVIVVESFVVSPPSLFQFIPKQINMPGKTLLILGSGPGIGVAVASNFAVRGFTHIALVSRDKKRLDQDEDKVYDAIQERGYSCQVKSWACDLTDSNALKKTLSEVESFGSLNCVLYNAARVAGKPPLEESVEDIERDFKVIFLGWKNSVSRTTLTMYSSQTWRCMRLRNGPSRN